MHTQAPCVSTACNLRMTPSLQVAYGSPGVAQQLMFQACGVVQCAQQVQLEAAQRGLALKHPLALSILQQAQSTCGSRLEACMLFPLVSSSQEQADVVQQACYCILDAFTHESLSQVRLCRVKVHCCQHCISALKTGHSLTSSKMPNPTWR